MTVPVHHHMPESHSVASFARQEPRIFYEAQFLSMDFFRQFCLFFMLYCVSSNFVPSLFLYCLVAYGFMQCYIALPQNPKPSKHPKVKNIKVNKKSKNKTSNSSKRQQFSLCTAFPSILAHCTHVYICAIEGIFLVIMQGEHYRIRSHTQCIVIILTEEMLCKMCAFVYGAILPPAAYVGRPKCMCLACSHAISYHMQLLALLKRSLLRITDAVL